MGPKIKVNRHFLLFRPPFHKKCSQRPYLLSRPSETTCIEFSDPNGPYIRLAEGYPKIPVYRHCDYTTDGYRLKLNNKKWKSFDNKYLFCEHTMKTWKTHAYNNNNGVFFQIMTYRAQNGGDRRPDTFQESELTFGGLRSGAHGALRGALRGAPALRSRFVFSKKLSNMVNMARICVSTKVMRTRKPVAMILNDIVDL